MKTITFEKDHAETAKKLLSQMIGSAPEDGYTIDQVRLGIKVLDKVNESTDESVTLEDAEHAFVLSRLQKMRWNIAGQDVVKFHDAIASA